MTKLSYRYTFGDELSAEEIEDSLLLAVMAAESLHGRSQVRLDAAFHLNLKKRTCLVHADTEVGRHVARLFTGFLTREFGETAFAVERVAVDPDEEPVLAGGPDR